MQKLIDEILAYMRQERGNWTDWYFGITNDPESRLFTAHNIQKVTGIWIHGHAGSHTNAREIEKYFLNCGCVGGQGGGGTDSCYVYAYKITLYTKE